MIVVKAFAMAALIIVLAPLIGFFLFVQLCKHANHIADAAYQRFGVWL